MASTVVQYDAPPGVANTLLLFAEGSDTIANGAGDAGVEEANRGGTYLATVTEALVGWYKAHIVISGVTLPLGWVLLVDDTNTYLVVDRPKVDVDTIKGQSVTLSGGVTIPAATLASTTNGDWNKTAPDNTQGAAVITALGNGTVVLHSDYDAAKDAASQTSVNDMPTNAEFEARTLATADYGTATNQTTLLDRLTASRAGYLDNLNVGGAVASNADILALNQSASRRILLTTVGQYERPESGSTVYTIEARTFDGDGVATNADSSPTLTGTGQTTGSLAANIGTISNPATGVYRWEYTVASGATIEPARFDVSATISSSAFTLSVYTQVVDFVAATWTSADASKLTTLYDDWVNGGRLDNILDDIPTNSELATALAAADDATLSAIATLNFATPTNVTDAQTAIIAQVDANEAKIDNIQTSINTIDGIVDNILIDTNELQTDWANGGRLDSIIDLILADTGTDGIVISSTTANQIADAILTRDWTLVSGEAARSALNALRILRNKVSESGGTLTITEEDDSTTAWTASVTTSVSANPITIIDPS